VGAGCNRNHVSKMTATGDPPHLVLASSIVQLQQDMGVMREGKIAKLEQLPEALKQSMLENFQIEGTVPSTRHEMQDLKKTIENSLQSIASRSIPTALITHAPTAGHENDVNHYATWNWGGRLHPVPEHFEFPV
jgi:hypothetical protein